MFALRNGIITIGFLLCLTLPAAAEVSVSVSIGLPHVSIGINLPGYPVLAPVPGYPVYYAPGIEANYFFYDGYYWVYQNDYWYASDWYNGPWWAVEPDFVPLFILRIPVVYYRHPPSYFYGWHTYEPPRWGQHWGHEWERRHGDWKHWQRDRTPAPAPRPDYQRGYHGQRYPKGEQQQNLQRQHYRYQPRDTQVREYVQPRVERKDQRGRRDEPAMRSPGSQQSPQPAPSRQGGWSGQQSQPAPQQSQEQRRPSGQEGRQPGVQDRERERDRHSDDYRSSGQRQKAPEGRNYERYGRGQGRDKEKPQGSGWGKENRRERD